MTWANSQSESIHCQWQRDSLLISLYRRIKGTLLIFVGVFLLVSCYQVKKAVFCSEKLHLYIAQRSLQIPYHFCWCELWNPHVSPIQMDGVANISCLKNRIWIFLTGVFVGCFRHGCIIGTRIKHLQHGLMCVSTSIIWDCRICNTFPSKTPLGWLKVRYIQCQE